MWINWNSRKEGDIAFLLFIIQKLHFPAHWVTENVKHFCCCQIYETCTKSQFLINVSGFIKVTCRLFNRTCLWMVISYYIVNNYSRTVLFIYILHWIPMWYSMIESDHTVIKGWTALYLGTEMWLAVLVFAAHESVCLQYIEIIITLTTEMTNPGKNVTIKQRHFEKVSSESTFYHLTITVDQIFCSQWSVLKT